MEKRKTPRKRVLVLFVHNHIGGAMTALVNFVNALDPDRYEVDLLFYEIIGAVEGIDPKVHILPQGRAGSYLGAKLRSPAYCVSFLRSLYFKKVKRNKLLRDQLLSRQGCRFSRPLDKHYDIAVSFELCWPFYYMNRRVDADRKLVWHHNDYHSIGFRFKWDQADFDRVDAQVFVSQRCMEKFEELHPQYRGKCFFMPNIMAKAPIVARAEAEKVSLPFAPVRPGITFVTVARMEFVTKGLDRMIPILCRLRQDGLLDRIRWLVIGGGRDAEAFDQLIQKNGLEQVVYPIGMKENPLPYLKLADAFLLPSRNEGKPIVVTEAQILGLVPVVTHYTSATEQIEDGVDGRIFENTDEGLYQGLKELLLHPEALEPLRSNLRQHSYTNETDISRFDDILEALDAADGHRKRKCEK
ncbi:MAG: glycosyltransferase [Aristaeellaceae bacterium]